MKTPEGQSPTPDQISEAMSGISYSKTINNYGATQSSIVDTKGGTAIELGFTTAKGYSIEVGVTASVKIGTFGAGFDPTVTPAPPTMCGRITCEDLP